MQQYNIEISPKADIELSEAVIWYEEAKLGLGYQFYEKVTERLALIQHYPERYPKVKGKLRQISIQKFPYCIIYYIKLKEQIITIVSIFHHSRNPKKKFLP